MKLVKAEIARSREHSLTEDARRADFILLFERNSFKTQADVRPLLESPLLQRFPDKSFCVNFDDQPVGLLPGAYVSMPRSRFDWRRHRAIAYVGQYNEVVSRLANQRNQYVPNLLYSFRGSNSSPARARLLAELPSSSPEGRVTESTRWFDHTEEEKLAYAEEILRSKFVLCPRGVGTSSIRLYEAMELGRALVVISDEWVEPPGPDWLSFAAFVAEDHLSKLPPLLREMEPSAPEMGRRARRAWELWFSPTRRVHHILRLVRDLSLRRPASYNEQAYRAQWTSWRMWARNGWTMPQRIRRKMAKIVGFAQPQPAPRPKDAGPKPAQ
jgi:hypothetical protein